MNIFNNKKIFTIELAELLASGLALQRSLRLLLDRSAPPDIYLQKILLSLQNGLPLSQAVEKQKEHYDPLLPFFLRSGETKGDILGALNEFNAYLEEKNGFFQAIKKQLFYPALVLCAAACSFFLMSRFMLPTLTSFFQDSQIAMPRALLLIIGFNAFFQKNLSLCLALLALCGYFIYQRREKLLPFLSDKLPLLNTYRRRSDLWSFFQDLAILTQNGLSLTDCLDLQESLFKSPKLQKQIGRLRFHLKDGLNISQALAKEKWLDPLFLEIIRNAEDSGKLSQAFQRIALLLKKELAAGLSRILAWLEPGLTLFLGALIALFLFLSFYPLLKILDSLG